MSMLLTDAAAEVARVIGGQIDSRVTDLATRMIKASLRDWQAARKFNFLLKDTVAGFSVASCVLSGSNGVVSAPTTGAFDGVNIGITVTGTGVAANTTVSSYSRNTDGTIASITLSSTPSAGTVTLTFGGNIPIISGTNEYNLPPDYDAPYNAYLSTVRRNLVFIQYREWNKKVTDQTSTGAIEAYTIYNPISAQTQNYGHYRMRLFRTPAQTDTLFFQYYRTFNVDATYVDIPDTFLDRLIDYAQWRLLRYKDSEDPRLPALEAAAKQGLQTSMNNDDSDLSEDDSYGFVSQIDAWNGDKPLWNNGAFYPYQI